MDCTDVHREWVNPYHCTKPGVDTLSAVGERRLRTRLRRAEGFQPSQRVWEFDGGTCVWAFEWATRFWDAGMLAAPTEYPERWTVVVLTRAGAALMHAWRHHPFTIDEVPIDEPTCQRRQ